MKVKITDVETSIRLYQKFGWGDTNKREIPYQWTGRIDKLTPEEINKGLSINPQAKVYPINLWKEMVQEDLSEYSDDYTARIWPEDDNSFLFMHYGFPAYTVIPEGETGTFIEVQFEDEED